MLWCLYTLVYNGGAQNDVYNGDADDRTRHII